MLPGALRNPTSQGILATPALLMSGGASGSTSVVVLDEVFDLSLEVAGQEVVFRRRHSR
jgi:hypothetical protein